MTTLTYPPEMAGFRPHGAGTAHLFSGDGAIYHAVLGHIEGREGTFYVWVWKEGAGGALTHIPVVDPPNNAPTLVAVNGRIILYGVREIGPNQRIVVRRDIAPYIDPVAFAVYNSNGGTAAGLRQILAALTKENQRLEPLVGD